MVFTVFSCQNTVKAKLFKISTSSWYLKGTYRMISPACKGGTLNKDVWFSALLVKWAASLYKGGGPMAFSWHRIRSRLCGVSLNLLGAIIPIISVREINRSVQHLCKPCTAADCWISTRCSWNTSNFILTASDFVTPNSKRDASRQSTWYYTRHPCVIKCQMPTPRVILRLFFDGSRWTSSVLLGVKV